MFRYVKLAGIAPAFFTCQGRTECKLGLQTRQIDPVLPPYFHISAQFRAHIGRDDVFGLFVLGRAGVFERIVTMKALLRKFADDEFGNAVIDWTVLMAGMVMMAMAVVFTITTNVDSITEDTNERIKMVETALVQS